MQLAEQVGVSMRTVGNWEQMGRVPAEQLPKLTEVLGEDVTLPPGGALPVAPSEINYRGWVLRFTPKPGASPEDIRRAEAAVLDTAVTALRELGLDSGD